MLHPGAKFNLLAASTDNKFAMSSPGCRLWETSNFQGLFTYVFPQVPASSWVDGEDPSYSSKRLRHCNKSRSDSPK